MSGEGSAGLKWVTLFDNMNAKAENKKSEVSEKDGFQVKEPSGTTTEKQNKRMSVERIYQKKTQLEHILLRPDSYIGSVEPVTQQMWVFDTDLSQMIQREVTFVPGLYKIFDEILVNAADNKQRDKNMSIIKIDIDPENNKIKIWNNGKGIPVVEHKTEKMFVPSLIFGHLLTSSNYNDEEKKVTGGRNGYGAKLCNIFSKKFTVETSSKEYRKCFRQTWSDNMGKASEAKIFSHKEDDFTCVTFEPDLAKFKMESLDKDTVDLFSRRAYDIAATSRGVKVFLNGKRLAIKGFKDYVDLYIKDKTTDTGDPLKIVYENTSERWEIAVTQSDKGFQQVSFVNSIATTKGGRHVDHVSDQVISKLIEVVKKKDKGSINIKPFQVKNHLWVFVNCLIENPTFDSQTKENMTLQVKSFGSRCALSETFIKNTQKCGIVESILSWMKFKAQEKMNKKCHTSKHSKLKGIPKLDDANDAGTKNSQSCTLILTEGDSAKTLAVSGLSVVGRDHYGVFPLKGKLLNVREASHKQIMENAEINNIIKIVGLQYKQKYDSEDSLKSLRYGKIMIMADQDQDGSHIKGLMINFIHHNWPNLLKHNFVEEFITPIVKVSKSKEELSFYSLPEFEEWKSNTDNWHTWKVKYYKGLGTSTSKEAKEYFSDMKRHRIGFRYTGGEDDASIILAFSKKKIEERKEWLTNWMEERKRRDQLGLPELYLYNKETKKISFNEFVNRELILFSNMDNERSIPSMVDGLKPGQRKVLYTCFKRNLTKEIKVAQLAGSVAEHSAYHHGENSLMGTIINLAQNFVGSNNLHLLQPIGQFGTRLHGGKDAASPRYIFTSLSTLSRHVFSVKDEALLRNQFDDSQKIEPEWYMPILPMVLVNGSEGIGTGWSTKLPNYDIREVINNLRRMINGEDVLSMAPSFKNFKGTIEQLDDTRYVVNGEVSIIDDTTIEITELPIRTWTQQYKENVMEPMLQGTEKVPALISDYKEYHTDTTVKFVVKMTAEKLAKAEEEGLHKVFKLQTTISINSMVLFDGNGCIKRYSSVDDILREFFTLRLEYYQKRKDYMVGLLTAESLKLDNQARFIMEKIDGVISIENKPKKQLIQMLVQRGYDSDPLKAWKESQEKMKELMDSQDQDEEDAAGGPDFNYILNMPLWSLSKERKDDLIKQRDGKAEELYQLKLKAPTDLWEDDLTALLEELDKVEEQERLDEILAINKTEKPSKMKGKRKLPVFETKPSPMGRRVEPRIDTGMKQKVEKAAVAAARKKLKKENLAAKLDFEAMDDDDDEDNKKSLLERLGGAGDAKTAIKKETKKPAKPRKPRTPSTSPSKKGKKGKKRNPWSDSESEGSDLDDNSDLDDSGTISVEPRNRAPRRAAATKAKYIVSEEEVEDEDEEMFPTEASGQTTSLPMSDGDDDDYTQPDNGVDSDSSLPPKPPAKSTLTKKNPVFSSDNDDIFNSKPNSVTLSSQNTAITLSSDNEDDYRPITERIMNADKPKEPAKKKTLGKKPAAAPKKDAAPKEKKAAPKKRAPKKKKDADSDLSGSDMDIAPKKTAKPKKATQKRALIDSDFSASEDEFMPIKKKSTAAKKSKNDEDDEYVSSQRATTGRVRAPVRYNFGESSEDDDF